MNTQQKTGQSVKPTREELLNIWNYSTIEGAQDYLNPIAKDLEQECRNGDFLWACKFSVPIAPVKEWCDYSGYYNPLSGVVMIITANHFKILYPLFPRSKGYIL